MAGTNLSFTFVGRKGNVMRKMKRVKMGKVVNIQFPPAEYEKLFERFGRSTCRSFSGYVRHVLMGKGIVIRTRNDSLEQFLETAIDIKNELHAIINSDDKAGLGEMTDQILELMLKIYNECKGV
jgi:hypothetical protein